MMRDTNICCVRSGKTELLVELVARKLDPHASARIRQHAANCDACREFIATQAELWALLDADAAPTVSPSFDVELYGKIADLQTESWWRRMWRWIAEPAAPSFARPAAAVSIALTLVVAVVLTRAPQADDTPAATQNAVFVNADVETIEETLRDFEMLQALGDLPRPL